MNVKNTTLMAMIILAAATRLIPHAPNFTALGAMALFAGAFLPNRILAVFVPLAALFLSDLLLGFHETMFFVYGALAITALLSFRFLQTPTFLKTAGLVLLTSLLFFVITNFGVWFETSIYAKNFSGLMECYAMAIPFFRNEMAGDFLFSGALFGAWELLRRQVFVIS